MRELCFEVPSVTVEDIDARNRLTKIRDGTIVLVDDASNDKDVKKGAWGIYILKNGKWYLLSTYKNAADHTIGAW